MPYLLSYFLFAIAMIEFILGFSVIFRENAGMKINWYFLALCICGGMWAICMSMITASDGATDATRGLIRSFLMLFIIASIAICNILVSLWTEVPAKYVRLVKIYALLGGFIAWYIIKDPSTVEFVKVSYGWSYNHLPCMNRILYNFYLAVFCLSCSHRLSMESNSAEGREFILLHSAQDCALAWSHLA